MIVEDSRASKKRPKEPEYIVLRMKIVEPKSEELSETQDSEVLF